MVEHLPPDAPPQGPLNLPQMILGVAGVASETVMTRLLAVLEPVVDGCGDEDFDRLMAQGVKAMLRSKGFESDRLEEAMTMGAIVTEFQRSLTTSGRRDR